MHRSTLYALSFLCFFCYFCVQSVSLIYAGKDAENNARKDDVVIISAEGEHISFPHYICQISSILSTPHEFESKREFDVPIAGITLHQLKPFVEIMGEIARNLHGNEISRDQIDKDTIFIHQLIKRSLIKKGILGLNDTELNQLLTAAHFLQIKPLIDGFAHFAAKGIYLAPSKHKKISWWSHRDPIQKNLLLLKMGKEEYTIDDYIAEHGQPYVEDSMLDLSGKNLTGLNGLQHFLCPRKIEKIQLNNNSMISDELPDHQNIFQSFTELTHIDLSHNHLNALPDALFASLLRLEFINLSGNYLNTLPSTIFNNQCNLKTLDLSYNLITTLPGKVFNRDTQLKKLALGHNQLTRLEDPDLFGTLVKLKSLDLQYNQLEFIHDYAFRNLTKLQTLSLADNRLAHLKKPDIFGGLIRLKSLDLQHNRLKSLHAHLFRRLPKLQKLFLANNRLTKLNESELFSELSKLKFLDLQHNRLESLDEHLFHGLRELQRLSLQGNHLTSLKSPNIFRDLTSLEYLSLEKNRLKTLHENVFSQLSKLKELSLADNRLFKMPPQIFASLVSVERLSLANLHNKIVLYSYDIYPPLEIESLQSMRSLQYVDLRRNNIGYLSKRLKHLLPHVNEIDLDSRNTPRISLLNTPKIGLSWN